MTGHFGLGQADQVNGLSVDGFCDSADGRVFRIRFLPLEPGEFAGRIFPIAERLAQTVLSLPMGLQLTRHDQARVTAAAQGLTSSDLTPHHPSP